MAPPAREEKWIPGSHLTVRPGMTNTRDCPMVCALQQWFPKTPANGQWPLGRLLCIGANHHRRLRNGASPRAHSAI